MIKGAGRPSRGRAVAGVALRCGCNMCRRLHLRVLCDVGSAVAVRAQTLKTGMAHHRWRPGRKPCAMAGVALGNGRNMIDRFSQRIRICITAAMAGGTLAGSSGMAHPRRLESRETGVAGVTLSAGRNMVSRFAERGGAIVTS